MKTAICRVAFFALLCSVPVFAQGPRNLDRQVDRGKTLIVDNVQYDRSEMAQFKDRPEMYWVVAKDAVYGFTTPEGVKAYGEAYAKPPGRLSNMTGALITGPNCSGFNKNVGCGGIDWLPLCTPNQISHISDSWNDVISCVETGSSVGKWTVLYKCYNFDPGSPSNTNCAHILWIAPGYTVTDLNAYEMNNITSSIRFCSNVDPYSCT